MGKSSKKKKKNADFIKPKLKVGKKKPNATNHTDIAFKSSAINLLAQLEEKTEPTNRRNLSLKVSNFLSFTQSFSRTHTGSQLCITFAVFI